MIVEYNISTAVFRFVNVRVVDDVGFSQDEGGKGKKKERDQGPQVSFWTTNPLDSRHCKTQLPHIHQDAV